MGSSARRTARLALRRARPTIALLALILQAQVSVAAATRPPPPPAVNPAPVLPVVPPAAPAANEETDAADTDTPRQALQRFLANARAGRLNQAADDLSVISQDVDEMAQLARKLQAVIDRKLPFDEARLAKISDLPGGSKDDGMAEQEELGRIDTPVGSEPLRLVRRQLPDGGTHWIFSQKTVERIPGWYERLPDHWLLDHLPESLLVTGPGGLLYWQWLALPLLIALSALFGVLFSIALRIAGWMLLGRNELFSTVLERQTAPLRLFGTALALRLLLLSLFITATAEQTVRGLCNVVLIAGFIFILWRAVDVLAARLRQSAWLAARPALAGMAPLLHRLTGLSLWAVGILGSVEAIGYSVTAVLASLGLGGLAIALAAKNSLEHLIGGMTLSLDQPMRVGDLVKAGDVQGQVEEIGIRSTRIRTQDRSLVTIPNGKLADLNIETLAARDRLRLSVTLNLTHGLKAKKLLELREALIACIKEQPLVIQDKISVQLIGLTETAIPMELSCWFQTADSNQLAEARHTLLLAVLEVVDFFGAFAAPPPKK